MACVPAHCGSEGFDLGGNRVVQSGYWETWWEYVWEANPARTDAHYPWARVFWQDGGGRPGLESGGRDRRRRRHRGLSRGAGIRP